MISTVKSGNFSHEMLNRLASITCPTNNPNCCIRIYAASNAPTTRLNCGKAALYASSDAIVADGFVMSTQDPEANGQTSWESSGCVPGTLTMPALTGAETCSATSNDVCIKSGGNPTNIYNLGTGTGTALDPCTCETTTTPNCGATPTTCIYCPPATFCLAGVCVATLYLPDYPFATWTQTPFCPGGCATWNYFPSFNGAGTVATLYEPNSIVNANGQNAEARFSNTLRVSGNLCFDWSFNWDVDACCSGFGYYINGNYNHLINGCFANPYLFQGDGSGHVVVSVNAGDVLTFAPFSADQCCNPATIVITNFVNGLCS